MTNTDIFRERRTRALAAFSDGVAILPSARVAVRSNDTDFPYRQDSDFVFLTGFNEPNSVLVLAPEHPDHRVILFLQTRDPKTEVWDGKRLGVERAVETLGVDAAFPIEELEERLPGYLTGVSTAYYTLAVDESFDRRVHAAIAESRSLTRRTGRSPDNILSLSRVLHTMRQRKDSTEIATLRRAAEITLRGHERGMRGTRPGLYEYEIQALIEYEYRRAGAQHLAYDSIVAAGDNALTLHYINNRDRLEAGTLLLVDSGCELDCYATDVTRTWPVSGKFTPEQRAVYEIVLAANEAGIAAIAPGKSQRAFHDIAVRTIVEGLLDLNILTGNADENIERETYREYYMHGTGHWLGLDVHDVGPYRDDNDDPVALETGMVTTVEPGIYIHRDAPCADRFKRIGIRIEDDILVTADGRENLTRAIPKQISDLESLVGSEA